VNVPNILTAMRFVLIPVFAYYLCIKDYYTAVSLFLLGGLTDILDGFIARKYNLITPWGKLADPLADKLMQITALVILSIKEMIPMWLLVIVIAKEVFMGIGTILLYKQQNYVVSANWYGKMATVVFYLAIIMIIFKVPNNNTYNPFIFIAVLATLFAFSMYVRSFRQIKNTAEKNTNPS
jgi:cardiolipin synthase (CMP-forming)